MSASVTNAMYEPAGRTETLTDVPLTAKSYEPPVKGSTERLATSLVNTRSLSTIVFTMIDELSASFYSNPTVELIDLAESAPYSLYAAT